MSQSDRELLEMAAKAAGYELNQSVGGGFWVVSENGQTMSFNPMMDDGDALRLAAKLKMDLLWKEDGVGAGDLEKCYQGKPLKGAPHTDEPAQAYRTAIVRAAAEIGRSMP